MAKPIRDVEGYRRYERQIVGGGGHLGHRLVEPDHAECYFCDRTEVQSSKEHVIPQWLQDDLDIRDEVFSPTYSFMGQKHQRGEIPVSNLVGNEGICQSCNSGWMSQIEADFQPFIRARRREVPIAPIVRWFVKTGFVLNVTQNMRLLVPRSMRIGLASGHLDARVGVYFHRVRKVRKGKGRVDWAQTGGGLQPGYLNEKLIPYLTESLKQLWSCAIRIDDIVGTVVVNPEGDLYRSSWEVEGEPALEDGQMASRVGWSHLNKVSVFGNAAYLAPMRWSWGDADEYRKNGTEFPRGVEGPEELQLFTAALTARLAGNPSSQDRESDGS